MPGPSECPFLQNAGGPGSTQPRRVRLSRSTSHIHSNYSPCEPLSPRAVALCGEREVSAASTVRGIPQSATGLAKMAAESRSDLETVHHVLALVLAVAHPAQEAGPVKSLKWQDQCRLQLR